MLHQDLKPDNVMIDHTGTLKIIDFGATRVAGMMEIASPIEQINLLGAAQYAAPEYFLGESGSSRSDIFFSRDHRLSNAIREIALWGCGAKIQNAGRSKKAGV